MFLKNLGYHRLHQDKLSDTNLDMHSICVQAAKVYLTIPTNQMMS